MAIWEGRTALIIAGAPQDNLFYVTELFHTIEHPVVVCADRGLEYALQLGLQPDLLVADCDSSPCMTVPCEFIRLTPEKDDTDTMHALNISIERGCKNVMIVCATGGRIDHMLANLSLCEYCAEKSVFCTIADARNRVIWGGNAPVKLKKDDRFRFFSMVPLDYWLEDVDIVGAKYPLQKCRISRSEILTISNEFVEETVEIRVGQGRWLLIRSGD